MLNIFMYMFVALWFWSLSYNKSNLINVILSTYIFIVSLQYTVLGKNILTYWVNARILLRASFLKAVRPRKNFHTSFNRKRLSFLAVDRKNFEIFPICWTDYANQRKCGLRSKRYNIISALFVPLCCIEKLLIIISALSSLWQKPRKGYRFR